MKFAEMESELETKSETMEMLIAETDEIQLEEILRQVMFALVVVLLQAILELYVLLVFIRMMLLILHSV